MDEPASGASVVIATDVEWGLTQEPLRSGLLSLCGTPHAANLLIMDGQCLPEEIARFRGWGHSNWQEVAEVATQSGIPRALDHPPRPRS